MADQTPNPGAAPDPCRQPPAYTVLPIDLSAALLDFVVLPSGKDVASIFIGAWPGGVTLKISFGGKQYITIPSPEGKTIDFGTGVVEGAGVRLTTTGVSATPAEMTFFGAPTFIQ